MGKNTLQQVIAQHGTGRHGRRRLLRLKRAIASTIRLALRIEHGEAFVPALHSFQEVNPLSRGPREKEIYWQLYAPHWRKRFPECQMPSRALPPLTINGKPIALSMYSLNEADGIAMTWLSDELIGLVHDRRMKPADAELEALRLGLPSLERRPDPGEMDPEKEIYWTYPMAVAYLATGDLMAVREHWDRYREAWRSFRAASVGEGFLLETHGRITVRRTMDMDGAQGAHDLLIAKLQSGDLSCFGETPNDRKPIEVPVTAWANLKFTDDKKWNRVTLRYGEHGQIAYVLPQFRGADILRLRQRPTDDAPLTWPKDRKWTKPERQSLFDFVISDFKQWLAPFRAANTPPTNADIDAWLKKALGGHIKPPRSIREALRASQNWQKMSDPGRRGGKK